MAEEGGDGEGGDPRLKMLEEYSLKTLKQVGRERWNLFDILFNHVYFTERRQVDQDGQPGRELGDTQ